MNVTDVVYLAFTLVMDARAVKFPSDCWDRPQRSLSPGLGITFLSIYSLYQRSSMSPIFGPDLFVVQDVNAPLLGQ